MLQPWRSGKIIRLQDETPATRRFWIEVPELSRFDFVPGQFVTLDLPIHEKPNKRWRSYSIASWPDDSNVFELIIVRLEEGAGTSYLFNEVTVGTTLSFRGAQGVFILPAILDTQIFLICTGTGIAPFRSMIQHIKKQQIISKEIYLVFGSRTKADLLYYDELKQLEKELPMFNYIPTLSREQWEGKTGYVHTVYEEICKSLIQSDNNGMMLPKPARFYLCGWKNMIDEAKLRINALGYDKKSIHLEIYG